MKYVFIAVLCACVIIAGRLFGIGFSRKIKMSENFIGFLTFAKNEMSFSAATVYEIVKKYVDYYPQNNALFGEVTEPISESMHRSLQSNRFFNQKQKMIILEFFDTFGTGDEEAGLNLIAHTLTVFREEHTLLVSEIRTKIKLANRLSLLLAAGVAILFI